MIFSLMVNVLYYRGGSQHYFITCPYFRMVLPPDIPYFLTTHVIKLKKDEFL
jgi:hypothetical protein